MGFGLPRKKEENRRKVGKSFKWPRPILFHFFPISCWRAETYSVAGQGVSPTMRTYHSGVVLRHETPSSSQRLGLEMTKEVTHDFFHFGQSDAWRTRNWLESGLMRLDMSQTITFENFVVLHKLLCVGWSKVTFWPSPWFGGFGPVGASADHKPHYACVARLRPPTSCGTGSNYLGLPPTSWHPSLHLLHHRDGVSELLYTLTFLGINTIPSPTPPTSQFTTSIFCAFS